MSDEIQKFFDKISGILWPNGDGQMDKELELLAAKLTGRYPKDELKRAYVMLLGLLFIAKDKTRERIIPTIKSKISVTDKDAEILYTFLFDKSASAVAGTSIDSPFMQKASGPQDSPLELFGTFGYEKTNPIQTENLPAIYSYLNRLEHESGYPINYKRIEGVTAANIRQLIDKFAIFDHNDKLITHLYISGYMNQTSTIAPRGFRLKP